MKMKHAFHLFLFQFQKLMKLGFDIVLRKGGENSGYLDSEYEEKGAKVASLEDVMKSELVASIDIPDFDMMTKGQMLGL